MVFQAYFLLICSTCYLIDPWLKVKKQKHDFQITRAEKACVDNHFRSVALLVIYLYCWRFRTASPLAIEQRKTTPGKEIEELQFKRDSLQVAIERLKTDSSYMAKIAREKYNMGLPDEEIIKIINKDSDALNEKQ